MGERSDLHALLLSFLPENDQNAYFQAPPSLQMNYPCFRYNLDDIQVQHADNSPYKLKKRYQVTFITTDPDSDIPDKVAKLSLCSFDRFFTAENLNHYVFNLYF